MPAACDTNVSRRMDRRSEGWRLDSPGAAVRFPAVFAPGMHGGGINVALVTAR